MSADDWETARCIIRAAVSSLFSMDKAAMGDSILGGVFTTVYSNPSLIEIGEEETTNSFPYPVYVL